MSDFESRGSFGEPVDAEEKALARYNAARASRGLAALSASERGRRDDLATRYGKLEPGQATAGPERKAVEDERDDVARQIAEIDGRIERKPTPMPPGLRRQIADIGRMPRGLRPEEDDEPRVEDGWMP